MGLIIEKIKVKWNVNSRKHYEKLGYKWTQKNDEFEIWNYELPKNSHYIIKYNCDYCGDEHSTTFQSYNRKLEKYGKNYCVTCGNELIAKENMKKTKLKKSIAQWLIEEFGNNALELYWDYEKNKDLDPWKISYRTNSIKIWIKCQEKSYHGSYETTPKSLSMGHYCSYCGNFQVHPLDSLKQHIVDNYGEEFFNIVWSDKNTVDPTTIKPNSTIECWWNCPEGKHEPYQRSCNRSITYDCRCPDCSEDKKESIIEEKTRSYLEELGYEVKTEYKCSLIPRNPKTKTLLPYDNEIILENGKHLIIEVHGRQHYMCIEYFTQKNLTTEETLHYQQVKDRYKRIKCIQAGYYYLELSYKTFDKKETYKKLINNKIKEILEK